jgi:outer membrane lipoprotein LolB
MRFAALGFCTALAACAAVPPEGASLAPQPPAFDLEGRVSVTQGEQSFTGLMRWRHDAARDDLLISTPLGQAVARIEGAPGAYTLTTSNGETHHAESAEALSARALGVTLPIAAVAHWATGQPAPDAAHEARRGAAGELERLDQADWRMDYRWREFDGQWRPRTIFMKHADIDARLVVDAWN